MSNRLRYALIILAMAVAVAVNILTWVFPSTAGAWNEREAWPIGLATGWLAHTVYVRRKKDKDHP